MASTLETKELSNAFVEPHPLFDPTLEQTVAIPLSAGDIVNNVTFLDGANEELVKLIGRESTVLIQLCDPSQHGAVIANALFADCVPKGWPSSLCVMNFWQESRASEPSEYIRRTHLKLFDCVVLYKTKECPEDAAGRMMIRIVEILKPDVKVLFLRETAVGSLLKHNSKLYGPTAEREREGQFAAIIERLLANGHLMKRTEENDSTRSGYKSKQSDTMLDSKDLDWSRVLPWLYIGNLTTASSAEFMTAAKISAVVGVGEKVAATSADIKVHSTDIIDDDSEDMDRMRRFLPSAVTFIQQAAESNKNVFVHCHAGRSRSATVVIAFLMRHLKLSLLEAHLLLCCRRFVVPHMAFLHAVQHFAQYEAENKALVQYESVYEQRPDYRALYASSQVPGYTVKAGWHVGDRHLRSKMTVGAESRDASAPDSGSGVA